MSEFDGFPLQDASAGLTRAEIAGELQRHRQRGYQVRRQPDGRALVLVLDEASTIRVSVNAACQLQALRYGEIFNFTNPTTLAEFRVQLDALASALIGPQWMQSPPIGRLAQESPASNNATIAELVGGATVEAVFDPYLTNGALLRLVEVLSFGTGTLGSPLRVMAMATMTTAKAGQVPRLTRTGFDSLCQEFGVQGEVRIMPSGEHRRFLLLSGGQSLLIGNSLNSLDKNEAVRLEPDTTDRAFFDQTWASADPLL